MTVAELRLPIEGIERTAWTVLQDDGQTRHPVRLLAMDQVANNRVRAPRSRTFSSRCPFFGQITQQSIEGSGRPLQYGEAFLNERCVHTFMVDRLTNWLHAS